MVLFSHIAEGERHRDVHVAGRAFFCAHDFGLLEHAERALDDFFIRDLRVDLAGFDGLTLFVELGLHEQLARTGELALFEGAEVALGELVLHGLDALACGIVVLEVGGVSGFKFSDGLALILFERQWIRLLAFAIGGDDKVAFFGDRDDFEFAVAVEVLNHRVEGFVLKINDRDRFFWAGFGDQREGVARDAQGFFGGAVLVEVVHRLALHIGGALWGGHVVVGFVRDERLVAFSGDEFAVGAIKAREFFADLALDIRLEITVGVASAAVLEAAAKGGRPEKLRVVCECFDLARGGADELKLGVVGHIRQEALFAALGEVPQGVAFGGDGEGGFAHADDLGGAIAVDVCDNQRGVELALVGFEVKRAKRLAILVDDQGAVGGCNHGSGFAMLPLKELGVLRHTQRGQQ